MKFWNTQRRRWGVAYLAILCGMGCGGSETGEGLIEVSGQVSYKGKPLSSGVVSFVPADMNAEDSFGASGLIDEEGHFVLRQSQSIHGVAPGEYKVRIESFETPPTMEERGELAIPARYFRIETSGVSAIVENSPPQQTIDLALEE